MHTLDTAQQRLTDALELGNEAAAATARGMHWLAARRFDRVLEELRAAERAVLLAKTLSDQEAAETRAAAPDTSGIAFEPLPEFADQDDDYEIPDYLRKQAS